uniref:Uncharacterized protein n=1 Tax=Panagrolaimus sp. PS1159 TaxID=55785 RepID=A0AC35FSM6_9BILA
MAPPEYGPRDIKKEKIYNAASAIAGNGINSLLLISTFCGIIIWIHLIGTIITSSFISFRIWITLIGMVIFISLIHLERERLN